MLGESLNGVKSQYTSAAAICQNDMPITAQDIKSFSDASDMAIKMLEGQITALRNIKGQVLKHIGECTKNPKSDLEDLRQPPQ